MLPHSSAPTQGSEDFSLELKEDVTETSLLAGRGRDRAGHLAQLWPLLISGSPVQSRSSHVCLCLPALLPHSPPCLAFPVGMWGAQHAKRRSAWTSTLECSQGDGFRPKTFRHSMNIGGGSHFPFSRPQTGLGHQQHVGSWPKSYHSQTGNGLRL